jgi:hypothetical protein
MVTKTYISTAALSMECESPIMLPTLLPSTTAPVSVMSWLPGVDVSSSAYGTHGHIKTTAKTTGVFVAPATDAINGDPRSRQAKQAAPPRGFR